MGQPSWFHLGDELHHAENLPSAEDSILSFKRESRWFKSLPRAVSRKEYEEWLKKNPDVEDVQNERSSVFYIPMKMPYPPDINTLAKKDQGATLQMQILKGNNAKELNFKITLSASERIIIREAEHGYTNVLPILFAFYLDGKPISIEIKEPNKSGGAISFIDLVEVGNKKTWSLKVNRKSIDSIVGSEGKILEIVALFSERQHTRYSNEGNLMLEDATALKGRASQILIISNFIKLTRIKEQWE